MRVASVAFAVVSVLSALGCCLPTTEEVQQQATQRAINEGNRAAQKTQQLLQQSNDEAVARKTAEAAKAAATIHIEARDLIAAYESNEVAADLRFKGQRLRVEGPILDIGKDVLGTMYVTLGTTSWQTVHVSLLANREARVAKLRKGQRLWVEGRCLGLTLGSVIVQQED